MIFINGINTVSGQTLRIIVCMTEFTYCFVFQVYNTHSALGVSDVKMPFSIIETTPVGFIQVLYTHISERCECAAMFIVMNNVPVMWSQPDSPIGGMRQVHDIIRPYLVSGCVRVELISGTVQCAYTVEFSTYPYHIFCFVI